MDPGELLTTVLARRYGLAAVALEPVPDGFTRRTWSAWTRDSRYAVKVRVVNEGDLLKIGMPVDVRFGGEAAR